MPREDRAPPSLAGDAEPDVATGAAPAGAPEPGWPANGAGQEKGPAAGPDPAEPAGPEGAAEFRRDRPLVADPVAWLIALITFAAYDTISVFRYLRLDPGSWDLGIFTEYVKQAAHLHAPVVAIRGAGFNLLGDHFQPIVVLIAPFFRVFPTPETLLVAQALLTAVSVIPVCRAARELLGTWPSRGIGLAYGLSWGLQQMIDFDFHEIAFAVPLLAFSLSALVRRRLRPAVLWALPLVFVKEDQGFTIAAIGLVMAGLGLARLRSARSGSQDASGAALPPLDAEPASWIRSGIFLAGWGLAWSALAIAVIIPHFNPTHHYPYWNDGGVVAPGAHLSVVALAHQLVASGSQKLWTVYLILLPAAFLALRSPLVLIAVPSLALRFVSTNNYFWGDGWHYNATVMTIVFLAAVDGMARMRAAAQCRPGGATPRNPPGRRWRLSGKPPGPIAQCQPGGARHLPGTVFPGDTPDPHGPAPPMARHSRGRRAGPGLPRPGELVARYGAVVMVVLGAWLAFRFPLAGLWQPQTYQITPHVAAEDAAIARVPGGVTVEATLSMLAPLAARDDTYWIGTSPNPAPAYVVFDNDDSGWSPAPTNVLTFVEQRHPGWAYQQIFLDNNVYVFRRQGRTGG
jgi:uncharacterized membrane protein